MADETNWMKQGMPVARSAIALALVAGLAFFGGVYVGGTRGTASVISHLPLIGDGLDPTPDLSADLADFWKAWNTLNAKYVETHASSTLPSVKEKIYGAIQGLADSYKDPYTVFLPPEESKAFKENISGSFAGVGMEIDIRNDILVVVSPLRGTPAEEAGIRAGDQILAIDGEPTDGLSVESAVRKIRGAAGTVVELSILRDKKPMTFKITRRKIQIPQTEDVLDAKSGVYRIALFEFSENSPRLFAEALSRFAASGSKKLVIDLRSNPGGYLEAAVDIAGHFLPRGAEVVIEDFGGKEPSITHVSAGYKDVPPGTKIVVLIDIGSASASEILAGALKDHKVATIVGTRSFGKGSVQELVPLDGGSLKVTVAKWVTPSGRSIMDHGITPDLTVTLTEEDVAQKNDKQLARAVEFLTTGR